MIVSKSAEETINAGKNFAETLKPGSILGLKGDLGTGKTQFVKGICEYFNVENVVNSPTFIIVNEYNGKSGNGQIIQIYHFDLYRLKFSSELEVIGFNEYLNSEAIVLIEWPKIAEEYLRLKIDTVFFEYGQKADERTIIY